MELRGKLSWLIPAAVVATLIAPLLFSDATFSSDWGNHFWLIWVQGLDIRSLHEPSYYLQSSLGAFYPYYAFYGGSFYAAAGLVSAISSAETAAILAYLAALAMAYLSWTWIALQAGVRGWRAQLPGCVAVTAPLAVTNLYGRGDVPEVVATAALPLVAAAAISFVREPRPRLRDATAFVLGIVVVTGTHTLTLVWGSTFLVICAALLLACYWPLARERGMRLLSLVWLAVLGACVNAWVLAPLILFHTRLMEHSPDPIELTAYTDPGILFSPLRDGGNPYEFVTADVNAQLPVLALAWALVCGILAWRHLSPRRRAVATGLIVLATALVALILNPGAIEDLPEALRYIQFPYRIVTYVDLCIVGLVTIVLAGVERTGRPARLAIGAIAAIAIFNVALAMGQNVHVRSWLSGREEALASSVHPPRTWYAPPQYADASAPIVQPTLPQPLRVPVETGIRNSYAVEYPAGPAGTVATNIATGTYLVRVRGAEAVGRTPGGRMVVRLSASRAPRLVEVSAAWNSEVTVARWVSLVALLIAFGGAAAWVGGRRFGSSG